MDSIKCRFYNIHSYDTLCRVYSVHRYHGKNTSHMMRRLKPVTYLKHVLDMEIVYEMFNVDNYRSNKTR